MITVHPPVGSRWWVKIGPSIPEFKVVVLRSGHGVVVIEQAPGETDTYLGTVDIQIWARIARHA